jgi:hypothetical protein
MHDAADERLCHRRKHDPRNAECKDITISCAQPQTLMKCHEALLPTNRNANEL